MRMQHEHFVSKGQTFYDTFVTPVLGTNTIFVYELLRRYVDRKAKHRSQVYTIVRQSFLATLSGLNRSTINGMLAELEKAGWIQSEFMELGGSKKYVLGVIIDGQEMYHADSDLMQLAEHFHALKSDLDLDKLTDIPTEVRFQTTLNWYKSKGCSLKPHRVLAELGKDVGSANTLSRERFNQRKSQREKSLPSEDCQALASLDLARSLGASLKEPAENLHVEKYPTPIENYSDSGTAKAVDLDAPSDPSAEPESPPKASDRGARTARALAASERAAKAAVAQARENALRRHTSQARASARAVQSQANLHGDGTAGMSSDVRQQVVRIERLWRSEIRAAYPDLTLVKWSGKERGQVQALLRDAGSGLLVENGVRYVVRNWKTLQDRYLKGRGGYPGIGFLTKLRTSLLPEAELWSKHADVFAEWDRATKVYDAFDIPEDLAERYRRAKAELERLGV